MESKLYRTDSIFIFDRFTLPSRIYYSKNSIKFKIIVLMNSEIIMSLLALH